MRGFKFNFITTLAFSLLVVYAYLAAMGWLYQGHSILIAGLFFIGVVTIVSACIYLMCKARATRWQNVGTPAQVALGVVIVVTFFYIGKPFSSYVTMMGKKETVYSEIKSVVTTAQELNTAYQDYARNRIENYMPEERNAYRKDIKRHALKMQLLPPDLANKQPNRDKWLDDILGMKIHNIQMPNNLAHMDSCVALWIKDYAKLSEIIFIDETNVSPFEYDTFSSSYNNLCNNLGGYSIWAFLVAILCSIFMLIPYFTTDQDFSLRTSSQKGLIDKVKATFKEETNVLPDENLSGEDYE